MFAIIIFFLFQIRQYPPPTGPCRLLETDRYIETCAESTSTTYAVDFIINYSIAFKKEYTETCYYYIADFYFPHGLIELFPEAREECSKNKTEEISFSTSLTISFDGKYVIPYCYGLENLYIYEIKSLSFDLESEIELKSIINIKDKIEAVRFFKDYLIVLDTKKIIAYSMKKGKEFKKIGEFPLEHRLYTPLISDPGFKCPTLTRNIQMDGDYLYLLNPPGNNYGPLLTFKINAEKIELINDGSEFKATFNDYEYIWRKDLILNEAHNKKYLQFEETAFYNKDGNDCRIPLLRIVDNIPVPIPKHMEEVESSGICIDWALFSIHNFKNEFGYVVNTRWRFTSNLYFTEDEDFITPIIGEQVYTSPIWGFGIYEGPDTELLIDFGRSVSCSTDDLPTIEYLIIPKEASENFLVMGKTYDSEGIRRVYAGYPWKGIFFRANTFQQADGSVIFMAVVPTDFLINPWCPNNEKGFVFMAIAEDWDGDSNNSPDVPYERDWVCISTKEEKDPLPIGEVEICPYEYTKNIYINGWALDNNGIEGGWLFSEDANILVPINYGIKREDIKEKYPEYPDSLNSGFEVQYDLSNLEEGVYEFYVRILAKDYQAIDFGPYKISIPKHKRPFGRE